MLCWMVLFLQLCICYCDTDYFTPFLLRKGIKRELLTALFQSRKVIYEKYFSFLCVVKLSVVID